jgi:hypothetical protein
MNVNKTLLDSILKLFLHVCLLGVVVVIVDDAFLYTFILVIAETLNKMEKS